MNQACLRTGLIFFDLSGVKYSVNYRYSALYNSDSYYKLKSCSHFVLLNQYGLE